MGTLACSINWEGYILAQVSLYTELVCLLAMKRKEFIQIMAYQIILGGKQRHDRHQIFIFELKLISKLGVSIKFDNGNSAK